MRRSGPFFPPPQAPVWSMVGQEGSAVLVGLLLGRLELTQKSTSLNTQGPWHPWATSGRGGCSVLARQLLRSNCPRNFPSQEPHETVWGHKGERTHFRSGCENLCLADEVLSMRRGQRCGLGSSGRQGVPLGLVIRRKGLLAVW